MCRRWQIGYFYFSYLPSIHDRPEFPDSRPHPRCFSWRRALRHERPQPELPHQSHVRRIPETEAGVLSLALHACPLLFAGPSPKPWSSLRSTKRSLRTKRYEEAAARQTHLTHWLQSVVQSVHLRLCCNLCWQIYDFASLITSFDLVKSGIFGQYKTKKERQVSLLHTHRPSSKGKYLKLKTSHVGFFLCLFILYNKLCMYESEMGCFLVCSANGIGNNPVFFSNISCFSPLLLSSSCAHIISVCRQEFRRVWGVSASRPN